MWNKTAALRLTSGLLAAVLVSACTNLAPANLGVSSPIVFSSNEMLNAHNQVRAPMNIPPLQWSPQLAAYAQQWATVLAERHSCRMRHRQEVGQDQHQYGENLFWASAVQASDGRRWPQVLSASYVANAWASEATYYNYARNSCQHGQQCGHYTQMVWRTSTQVGCGAVQCGHKAQLWVCNYSPAGNWIGERPY